MLLSIDPGKNIGYSLFTDRGKEIERGIVDFNLWFEPALAPLFLHNGGVYWFFNGNEQRIDQLVVEGYRHDPTVKQGGSLHWASQVEGSVKTLAMLTGTPVAVQYAGTALPVAKQITEYEEPRTKTGNKKHLPDQDSAWLHGIYWFHCQGIPWYAAH